MSLLRIALHALPVLLFAGCPRRGVEQPVAPPPPTVAGPKVVLPDGGVRHTERLSRVAWKGASFGACGRRTTEPRVPGVVHGCVVVERPGQPAAPLDWTSDRAFLVDDAAVDRGPGECRVAFDDAPGDPGAPAARATLLGPKARLPLDEWKPENTVDGDYFAVETSFSPDGKWLGIVHTAVGIGEGEQRIDVIAAELRPAPVCR